MSKVVGIVNGQKIYDDNLRLVHWQQNVEYIPVTWSLDDIAMSHCEYCGSMIKGQGDCWWCGAPLSDRGMSSDAAYMHVASDAELTPLELIKAAFAKWIPRLGLAWWDIDIAYYDDPKEIIGRFRIIESGEIVPATVTAQWMYADAKISINLPVFDEIEPALIERIIVHELCHILVNEMREDDIHHEERVVTGLTKAFFWVDGWGQGDT